MGFFRHPGRVLPLLAGLAIGVSLIVLFVINSRAPTHENTAAHAPTLTVIEIKPLPFRLEARGHGVVRPAETWQAIASVAGRVIEMHPDLEDGAFLRQGTPLLRLDPSRYQREMASAQAELARLAAEMAQLTAEKENTQRLLRLERERLSLTERELSRIERLSSNGAVAPAQLDAQRREALAQRQAVTTLDNQLHLIPPRRERLEAQIDQASAQWGQAQQNLDDTHFVAPYDLRLSDVDVEKHQYVTSGQRLFQADNTKAVEVEARVPLAMWQRLMSSAASPEASDDTASLLGQVDLSKLRAEVFAVGPESAAWPGTITHLSNGLDPQTRAARVVVTVDASPLPGSPPKHPSLQRNMYVRVHISAESPEPLLTVPASAIHQEEVYRVDEDSRLERQPVEVVFEQHDLAIIGEGLSAGDEVIVDDVVPAISGMRLEPRRDEALEQRLAQIAVGHAP